MRLFIAFETERHFVLAEVQQKTKKLKTKNNKLAANALFVRKFHY